jgi:hypothetical protein
MTGKEVRQAFEYLFSLKPDGSVMNGTFQYSKGFGLTVDVKNYQECGCRVVSISLNDEAIDDERVYTVGMTQNCSNKFKRYFGVSLPEEKVKLVAISTFSDLAKWMISQTEKIEVQSKGRFEILHAECLHNG